MKFFLGIDGGGTKTDFVLINRDGDACAHTRLQSSYYLQCGFDGVACILQQGLNAVLQEAGASFSELGAVCVGLTAFGEIEADSEKLSKIIASIMKDVPHIVVNDVVIGWAGALGLKPGINIVSGTGSITYGVDEMGSDMRCGGWGHHIGDEGSAYWIGANAVRHFSLQSDGREERTLLYERIKVHFALKRDFDIIDVFHKLNKTERAKISKVVSALAQEGDVVAQSMFTDAATELARMVKSVVHSLSFLRNPVLVSGTGGVFRSGAVLMKPLSEALSAIGCVFEEALLTPMQGAALMAATRLGHMKSSQLLPKLRMQGRGSGYASLCF